MTEFKELGPNVYGEAEVPSRATNLHLGHAHPILSVVEVDSAIDYYRTALGFFVEWAKRDETGSTTIANLWRGELSLFLIRSEIFGPSCVYCNLENRQDLESLHADFLAAGATVAEAPSDQPWGSYEMRVTDLDGNEITFACAGSASS